MTTVEVLEAARARVEKGWCQHDYGNINGVVCSIGAINLAHGLTVNNEEEPTPEQGLAYDLFGKAVGTRGVAGWNDAPGRTQAEVLDAFSRAIALARSAQ